MLPLPAVVLFFSTYDRWLKMNINEKRLVFIAFVACIVIVFTFSQMTLDVNGFNIFNKNINKTQSGYDLTSRKDKLPCLSKEGVAIMVPYRDREEHLRIFIKKVVPFIRLQNISFHIFIIEQSRKAAFNRAKLFNIGYHESLSVGNFSCFIFHDVDLIPTSPDNYYCCDRNPKHMAVGNEKYNFTLPYADYLGGVLAMTKESFMKTNGFANIYYGWGGEDDDMERRIKSAGMKITRPSVSVGRYKALKHEHAEPGKDRKKLVETAAQRITKDGIHTLNYTLLAKHTYGVSTHIMADIDTTQEVNHTLP